MFTLYNYNKKITKEVDYDTLKSCVAYILAQEAYQIDIKKNGKSIPYYLNKVGDSYGIAPCDVCDIIKVNNEEWDFMVFDSITILVVGDSVYRESDIKGIASILTKNDNIIIVSDISKKDSVDAIIAYDKIEDIIESSVPVFIRRSGRTECSL